jgi:cell division protein ZapA
MACEEGQEAHLTELATNFDRYVGHLKDQFGEIGDLRLTVMAGIMIMDEVSELGRKVSALQSEVEGLKSHRDGSFETQQRNEQAAVAVIGELAAQLAGLAAKLNDRAGSPVN